MAELNEETLRVAFEWATYENIFGKRRKKMEHMLIEYIRNDKNEPNGVVVAISATNIGWSLQHTGTQENWVGNGWKDVPIERWDRKKALMIAACRAKDGRDWHAELAAKYGKPRACPRIWDDLIPTLERMAKRATAYFKTDTD